MTSAVNADGFVVVLVEAQNLYSQRQCARYPNSHWISLNTMCFLLGSRHAESCLGKLLVKDNCQHYGYMLTLRLLRTGPEQHHYLEAQYLWGPRRSATRNGLRIALPFPICLMCYCFNLYSLSEHVCVMCFRLSPIFNPIFLFLLSFVAFFSNPILADALNMFKKNQTQ